MTAVDASKARPAGEPARPTLIGSPLPEALRDGGASPTPPRWGRLRRAKIPDLAFPLTRRVPLGALYSLPANADLDRWQEEMGKETRRRAPGEKSNLPSR